MISFVTYAQNFEDLMLWRALHGVQGGFYIDVGAADPDEDSVTRAFYDHGWRGVNIEPTPEHFAAISAARPRDINLRCLVGHSPGDMQLYNIRDTGLSTVKKDLAEQHATDGYVAEAIRLPVRTLADICREHAPSDIHFLKIDVEGAEADALRGADFTTYRPWIVLVEATAPNSPAENWEAWDPLLTNADYNFVWFDGLNRFYLASERTEGLGRAFLTPPNVFDYWVRPRGQQQMALLKEVHALQATMDRQREETTKARANLDADAAAARGEAQASRVEASAARAEADVLRAAESAARQEANAARIETATLRAALETAQRQATATRTEATMLRAALETALREATAARIEAAMLRSALVTAQQEATATRTDAATLRVALETAQQNVSIARTEIGRLGGVQQARELAEAMVAALQASTSWKVTAPLRGLSRGMQTFGSDRARSQRLRLVAELGQGPAGGKGSARIAVYGLGRFLARTSAGRATARLVQAALPGPYRWLHKHYAIYRNAAGSSTAMEGDQPPILALLSSNPALSQQEPNAAASFTSSEDDLPPVLDSPSSHPPQQGQNGLSAEEQIMLLRLRARDAAA